MTSLAALWSRIRSLRGVAYGFATLGADGKVPEAQLPDGGGGGPAEWGEIDGDLGDQADLVAALATKAATSHGHVIADTTGLQTALDGKASTSHHHDASYEALGAVATHAAAADPHTGYQRESEKGQANGYASLGAGATVPTAQLPAATTSAIGAVELATSGEAAAGVAVQGDDARLSDSRTPSGSASGDLGGSYPGPTVTQARGIRETAGPTTLVVGAVADGEYLRRVGSTVVGGSPAGGSGNALEVSIALTGPGLFSTTVTGQAWVTSSSKLVASPFATTADGLTPELYAAAGLECFCANRVAGVGFDLFVRNPSGAVGTYRFHVLGV